NLVCNSKGYSTYWETGMVFPNRILNDFILIFHPEAADSLKSNFYYYKKLN
ncbi:MAG: iron ABC transporter substrate-binding protein, partial [Bacteroidia bacterium]|nr:iron ABC transporter substrate-binding protein [Bacteroidia bacterium]